MARTFDWDRPVTYGAVGATAAADLLRYPPVGYRPIERRARIGHGPERFEFAWTTTLSWGIQRLSGFRVELEPAPPHVTEATYIPVSFDADGTPIAPATVGDDAVFAADGSALLAPGDTAFLIIPIGPIGIPAPCRVVYVVDEPKRKGFAYGTLAGHPEDGEEAFIVEHREDDSVWLTIRAFSRPSTWYWWAVYPALRLAQEIITRRYLRVLARPLATTASAD